MGGDPDTQGTPYTNPAAWTQVLDEQFANLDAWFVENNVLRFATTTLAANVSLIGGGGVRITGNYEAGVTNTGGWIQTNQKYLYGYFECRCKIPAGKGLWPAFWTSDRDQAVPRPEIDIFESIGDGNLYMTNRWKGYKDQQVAENVNYSDGYHIFALRWSPGRIDYYVDNVMLASSVLDIAQDAMSVLLDFLIGGDWAGNPVGVTFPVNFDVDYVKIWQTV